ncbi:DUF2200 domain-containing protein [Naumannella sp. ID2617S]|nr:DUF2200 domain-containing protein [Naumannella sp. ID2617S]
MARHRIFDTAYADIHPHYVTKVERKGRTVDELQQVIRWLTGYDTAGLQQAIDDKRTLEEFFGQAPEINPNARLITGSICGHRVEEIEDPLMQQIRQLDKLVDELAKGRPMDKVLRW